MNIFDILAVLLFAALVIAQLEYTHWRTSRFPQPRLGASPDSEENFAHRREVAELRDLEQLGRQ